MSKQLTGKSAAQLFGGSPEPRNTRERLLFTAVDLFYTHGFHAVGIDQILGEVGVTKTTFYNHFESKDDLARACVAQRDEWEAAAFMRMVQERAGYDPRAMLLAMFDVQHEWFTNPDYRGCIFISAAAEFPSATDPIHRAAAKHYLDTERGIAQIAKAAGAEEPDELAREWLVLLKGAFTFRLMTCDDEAALVAKRLAEAALARHLDG